MTPKHYDKPITPWMLQEYMDSSGDAFVDARRADAIEYAFRMKNDLAEDLKKARHCLDAAISKLEMQPATKPADKWRMLKDFEIIEAGDEVLSTFDLWKPSQDIGDYFDPFTHNAHRRRVTPDLSELESHIQNLLKHE